MDPPVSVKYEELPPLMWYDSLSPDAQKVMLALQRKYAKMREQINLTQMKKELFSQDPSEYYKSLYTRQFKAEPSLSLKTMSCIRQSAWTKVNASSHCSSLPSQAAVNPHATKQSTEESIQIKEEPPDSPFPSEQFYSSQFGISARDHSLHSRSNTINQIKNPNCPSNRNAMMTPAPTLNTCATSHFMTCNPEVTDKQERKRRGDSVCTSQSKQNRLSSMMPARQYYSDSNLSVNPQQFAKSQTSSLPKTSFSLEFSIEECDLSPVSPVHFPLEPEISDKDLDMELYEASQDLFSSTQELQRKGIQGQTQENCSSGMKNTFISKQNQPANQQQLLQQDQYYHVSNQDKVSEARISSESESHKRDPGNQDGVLEDMIILDQKKDQRFQITSEIQHVQLQKGSKQMLDIEMSQDLSPQKENPLHAKNNQQIPVQKAAPCQSHMDRFLQKPPCSVARKLEFNRKIRQTENESKHTQNKGKRGKNDNQKAIFPNLEIKQKPKVTVISETEISLKGNCDQTGKDDSGFLGTGLVDVLDLSSVEREGIRNSILQSRTVCLTLVYSNEATLIRMFHETYLQSAVSVAVSMYVYLVMKKAISDDFQLKYLAIKVMPGETQAQSTNKTSTLLFHCTSEDEIYMNWFKPPFKKLMFPGNPTMKSEVWTVIKDLMDNNNIEKIAMNAKQLYTAIFQLPIEAENQDYMLWKVQDPMIGSWLLNSDKSPKCLQDVIKESGIRQTFNVMQGGLKSLDSDLILLYDIMTMMKKKLKSQNLWELFCKIETRLIPVLAYLEMQKLLVDTATFISFSSVLKKKLKKLEEKAYASVGHSFCINSHPQLRQVLYEELRLDEKLPAKSKIAKTSVAQQKSTSEATLTQLKGTHSLPAIVLEYRQLQKLKSTYVDGMMSCVKNGYLSTHWDQTAAATGRLTSCQPNIQAIPKVPVTITEYEDSFIIGKTNDMNTDIYAREPFISHEGHLLLAADFQQIELRLLAHLADDHVLLGMFNNKDVQDIFIELTSQWLGKPVTEVSPSEREQTKRIVYSVMYGVGKEKLADYLKVNPDNAKSIMTSFLLKFPAVNSFTKKCVDFCQQHGFTQTIFKRKRLIPHINHSSYQLRAQASRQAVNFCVQGSAADLCKAAMLSVQDQLAKHSLIAKARLLSQIHDELLWEVDKKYLEPVKDIVKHVMEDSKSLCGDLAQLNVPIRVTLSEGKSWAHLHHCE